MVEKIHFFIDKAGEVQVSVEGATGNSCEALTSPFESILGAIAKRSFKDSYYEGISEETMVKQGEAQ